MEKKYKDIDKKIIVEIIKSFAENKKLFSNERQFQLALAWELKMRGYEVFLEVLQFINDKKSYIDIVVQVSEYDYVAIELKYTTRQRDTDYYIGENCEIPVRTFAQGAGDVRRYDFIKDIQRIENLIDNNDSMHIVKGYAIIMTNDNYNKECKKKMCAYREVQIFESLKANTPMELRIGKKTKTVELKNSYKCDWSTYDLENTKVKYKTERKTSKEMEADYDDKNAFRYMVIEVPNTD